jgi:putative transposase
MNHRPPHLYIDQTWYFITAHTIGKTPLFTTKEQKKIWATEFATLTQSLFIDIAAWVLLNNHYHLLCYFQKSEQIPIFVKRLHGATSYKLNKYDQKQRRKVWYSYWDHCVRDERDYWTKFNYIHYNPIKHGYVKNLDKWEFSSYLHLFEINGEDWFSDCWGSYPVVSFDFES